MDLIGGGSRSTTPQSLLSRKSPTVDMGVQVNQPQNAGGRRGGNQRNRERRDSGRGNRENDNQSSQSMEKGNNMRNQRPNQQIHPQQLQHQQQQQHPQQQRGDQNNRGWNRGSGNMMRGRGRGRGGPNQVIYYKTHFFLNSIFNLFFTFNREFLDKPVRILELDQIKLNLIVTMILNKLILSSKS